MEAIFEVYVDRFVEKTGSADQALLWVLQQEQFLEFSVRYVMLCSACKHACFVYIARGNLIKVPCTNN